MHGVPLRPDPVYVFGQSTTVFVPADRPFTKDGSFDVTATTLDGVTLNITLRLRATGATQTPDPQLGRPSLPLAARSRTVTSDPARFEVRSSAFAS